MYKLRTDTHLPSAERLVDLHQRLHHSIANGTELFLSSDRQLVASRDALRRLATLHTDPYFEGLWGVCGSCARVEHSLRLQGSGPRGKEEAKAWLGLTVQEVGLNHTRAASLGCGSDADFHTLLNEQQAMLQQPLLLELLGRSSAPRPAHGHGPFVRVCLFP